MGALRLMTLCAAASSVMLEGCGTPKSTSDASAEIGPEAQSNAASVPSSEPAPGVSTIVQCDEAVAWAERKRHDCEWAGVLLQAERDLRETCDLGEQTTELRQARLILTQCGTTAPEDMQSPEVNRDEIDPFRW